MTADAVIVEAVRTPLGKRGGGLTGVHPADLLATVLREVVARAGIDPARVDDVICGCVSQVGEQSLNVARYAWLAAGLPEEVPATTIDRQCGSSQQAIHFAAQAIMSGTQDLVIACGVEHMTRVPMGTSAMTGVPFTQTLADRYHGMVQQGISAELVASDFGLTREELDAFSIVSHERAASATKNGRFEKQIVPIESVTADEGIRFNPDPSKMASLPPAFVDASVGERFPQIQWMVTAGNSSQITDGAAALVLASREAAEKMNLPARARINAMTVVGADPIRMLTGPIPATRRALERAGLSLSDIDVVEINEAFASVPLAWQRDLDVAKGFMEDRVNPNGGAIALGHPLGASGARLMTTLLYELERRGAKFGLQTMCEGGGLSNATIIEMLTA